jgi:hypothetical protein
MSARSLTRPGRLAGLAALAVTLVGLFAMHGLSPHGASHSPTSGGAMEMAAGYATDLPVDQLPGHGSDELLMLCLALLVTGAVLQALRHRSVRWLIRDAVAAEPATAPAMPRRDRDPPDLNDLSIRRC